MRLNPKEQEKLMLHMAGNLAKERKERGLKLNYVEGTNAYTFTIKANGTLTLHVTDTGEKVSGIQVVGAKFIITDETGTTQGKEATTNQDGNALFENVPYYETDSPVIYYKQISSDGAHTFDGSVKVPFPLTVKV